MKRATFEGAVTISAISNKGGTGKTSVLANLAGVLLNAGARQLIIDCDAQGNISDTFGLKQSRLTSQIFFEGRTDPADAITTYDKHLHVIQAGDAMNTIEFDLLPNLKRYDDPFDLMRPRVEGLRMDYDYIFFDTPPSLGLVTGNVMAASDYVIIPFVPEVYAIKGLKRVLQAVKDFKEAGNAVEILAVVPMFIDSRTLLHTNLLSQARRYCVQNNIYMSDVVIPRSIRFPASIAMENKPATLSKDRTNAVVQSYYQLWDELKERIDNEQDKRQSVRTDRATIQ